MILVQGTVSMHFRKIGLRLGKYIWKIGIKSGIRFGKIGARNGYVFEASMARPLPKSGQVPPSARDFLCVLFLVTAA